MLKRLWLVLSLGWAALILIGQWNERIQDRDGWLAAFALAITPFAAFPIAAFIWDGGKKFRYSLCRAAGVCASWAARSVGRR